VHGAQRVVDQVGRPLEDRIVAPALEQILMHMDRLASRAEMSESR
jgi:hypothetical protein